MERRFERRRFVPVAELNTEGVLPRDLATDLRLARRWNEVAGAALASRARLVALRRGVLELEVEDSDWALAIRPLAPGLAGRLARRCPDLRIRRVRVRLPVEERLPEAVAITDGSELPGPQNRPQESLGAPARPRGGDPQRRLEALMERCLELRRCRDGGGAPRDQSGEPGETS